MPRIATAIVLLAATSVLGSLSVPSNAQDAPDLPLRPTPSVVPDTPVKTQVVRSKDRSRTDGVQWLKQAQHPDGGWSWADQRGSKGGASDVATTALAVLALHRDAAGKPTHVQAIERGTLFVVTAVEKAPDGPQLATPQGTQIQGKLGRLVDTHLAALMLGEVAGSLRPEVDRRVQNALDRVLSKVQQAQRSDGSFDADGWAPVLSSSIAAQSLYNAAASGKDIDKEVLNKADRYQADTVSADGSVDTSTGAGVSLYAVASTLVGSTQAKSRAGAESDVAAKNQRAAQVAEQAVANDTSGALMAGFGSIGGEEMLSYMMISDTLAKQGGSAWTEWNDKVGAFLADAQNADGSWVGHHCITSPVFTTAGAILTLAAEERATTRG